MCWHHDPTKRPTITEIESKIKNILLIESDNYHESNPTKIIKSSDIGPVTINNPSGIYESNSLSLIMSTESTRSLTEIDSYQSDEGSFNEDKRRLDNNLIEDEDTKKIRLSENDDDGIA
ncbi:hypothetical protein RhiirA5_355108 [Rhizophagus irregularis]|nr:hypothetical protein RhiirA5_366569 [Rhizophagus irregularis]PKC10780.1 hypothetical protein RhiirA5_355108 [Rhizophagus irregularis]PKC70518.1 hypothetical protein RhiirA1_414291 [Rhizophagus irregularis]PKK72416.1 hypothetical protein RhiirC2_742759 [Rhizophagus irregularis]PKY26788.1 hypothetical protein RhiirB3_415515 [Rhizophagus irregularis]